MSLVSRRVMYLFHRREKVARLTLSPTTDGVIEYHRLYRCPDSMTVGYEKNRGCQSESWGVTKHCQHSSTGCAPVGLKGVDVQVATGPFSLVVFCIQTRS